MAKKRKEKVFPRNLYKSGGKLVLINREDGDKVKYNYSTILVKDKEEYEKKLKDGWYDDFAAVTIYKDEGAVESKPEDFSSKATGYNNSLQSDDLEDF